MKVTDRDVQPLIKTSFSVYNRDNHRTLTFHIYKQNKGPKCPKPPFSESLRDSEMGFLGGLWLFILLPRTRFQCPVLEHEDDEKKKSSCPDSRSAAFVS